MAHFIPLNGHRYEVRTAFDIGDFQKFVGGFVRFIPLAHGDHMVCHEDADIIYTRNETASALAGQPICGPAILCQMNELV